MSLDFNLNNVDVNKFVADTSYQGSNYINKSGVYPVKIHYVRIFENSTGSKSFSIVCSIEGKKEQTIIYGSVFQKADGSKNDIGFNQIIALQTVCGINNLTEATQKIQSFKDANETLELQVFKEFEGKKIILQVVREFSKYNGKIRSNINFRDAFRTNDNANAAEIMFKKDFGKKMQWIKENPDKVEADKYRDVTKAEVDTWLKSKKAESTKQESVDIDEDYGELPF